VAKQKKHRKKKLKLKKKLKQAVYRTTLAEIQLNLGAMLTIRRWPGSTEYQCFLSNTYVKKNGAKHSSSGHVDCYGIGDTPSKARRDLAKKLHGRVLHPMDRGPCQSGKKEMLILGKVLSV